MDSLGGLSRPSPGSPHFLLQLSWSHYRIHIPPSHIGFIDFGRVVIGYSFAVVLDMYWPFATSWAILKLFQCLVPWSVIPYIYISRSLAQAFVSNWKHLGVWD